MYCRHYQPLSAKDIETIHKASMLVLEKTGFKIDNKKALCLFAENGAQVDFEKKIVKAKEEWIMQKLKKAPARIVLYGRDERQSMVVETDRTFAGTGGMALNIYDLENGERRPTTLEDGANIAKLVDTLENLDWYTLPIYPNDVPKKDVDLNRFYAGIKNTSKHVMGGIYGDPGDLIRLVHDISGGKDKFREKPFISVICSTISPLQLESRYVDYIFDLVEAGIPIATPPAPIAGATSPVTLAGTLVQINAEAICGILLCQLIKEGAPVLYSVVPTTADMKTMGFLFGAVENGIMNAACAQLASYYNLPMYSTGGVTESKVFDVQNGYEKCLGNLLPALAGAQLIHNAAGQIDSSMAVAYEQYVLDDEILGAVKRVIRGVEVTPDTLATEVIISTGPGGNFLSNSHTVKYLRSELFLPRVAVRANYSVWHSGGRKNALDKAREIVKDVLKNHQPLPLPEGMEKELRQSYPALRI
ncbi:MAG TPA: trimethylamine methyltransferase family protein [Bacillota bacterium]|nr:trimethylamine methyltransferase family protein [Bacillota bacterium]